MMFITLISSYAVKIDGIDDGVEWQAIENDVAIRSKHSNNVNYAIMKHQFINDYELCIYLYLSDNTSGTIENAGFIVEISDDFSITVDSSGARIKGDESKYFVDSSIKYFDNNSACCEILIGFKRGLPNGINGSVSFIDGKGINSYFYPFDFDSPIESTTELKTTKPEKTTKATTAKPPSTEKKTTTTKAEKTTTPKTTQKETQAKKQDKTYVYFYEKEVVVSQVVVVETVPTVVVTNNNAQESSTEILTMKSDLTTGFVLQRVVVIAGVILLIVGGAVAGMTIKKSKNSEHTTDANDSDE